MSDEQETAAADEQSGDASEETEESTEEAEQEDAPPVDAADESAADTEDEAASESAEAEADEADEAETDEAETDEADETEDAIEEGDVITLAYTMRTVENGTVIDTTDPELAEEEGLETEGRTIEPRTVVLGEGQVFPAVEEAIVGGAVGDEGTVVVPHDQAFGEYDPDEVETISTDRIPEESRFPGAQVEIDGRQGMVESVYPGRSRVDFNHPLAGEDLEYEYEVVGVVEDRVEKAKGLLNTYFEVDIDLHIETDEVEEEVTVEADDEDEEPTTETEVVERESLYLESHPQLQFNQQWLFSKQQIAQQLIDLVDVDRVVIQEIIDGQPAGMPGMMGGMGDVEAAIEDADVDAEEVVEELVDEEGGEEPVDQEAGEETEE